MKGEDAGRGKTWRQKLRRAWSLLKTRFGWEIPTPDLQSLAELYQQGREDEMMARFYELGGTVEKMAEASPPWSIDGDVWNEEDGEIWNVEPCYTGGRSVYVGNIFRDPVIRGKENPYFQPGWRREVSR